MDLASGNLSHRRDDRLAPATVPCNSHPLNTHRYQLNQCELSCATREVSRCGGCAVADWHYAYSRQRSTRMLASHSGSPTISMWHVSISMSVCTPPSATMHSC